MSLSQWQRTASAPTRRMPRSENANWSVSFIRGATAPVAAFLVHLGLVLAFAYVASEQAIRLPLVPAVGFFLLPVNGWLGHLLEPLFQLLLKVGYDLTTWPMPVVGVLISNLALLGALAVLYRLVRLDYGDTVATRTVWLFALFPTAFFFSAVYAEALFLLLTVASIYCARTDRWGRAAAFGFLAALTRN